MTVTDAYIYDHVRSPRGKGRPDGALHEITPVSLASQVLAALRDRSGLDSALIDDVVLGCVSPVGEKGGTSRASQPCTPVTPRRFQASRSTASAPPASCPIGSLPELDRPALAKRSYRAALEAAVAARYGKKDAPPPAYETPEPKQKIEVLTSLVKQQTGTEPQVPEAPEPPEGTPRADAKALREAAEIEFLERTARSGIVVADIELDRLAEERAMAVERALLGGGAIDPARVFKVREGKVSANEGKVRFELGLK